MCEVTTIAKTEKYICLLTTMEKVKDDYYSVYSIVDNKKVYQTPNILYALQALQDLSYSAKEETCCNGGNC